MQQGRAMVNPYIQIRHYYIKGHMADRVFIDVRASDLTLSEIFRKIQDIQSENPDLEIFLDGDRHAIMGRKRTKIISER